MDPFTVTRDREAGVRSGRVGLAAPGGQSPRPAVGWHEGLPTPSMPGAETREGSLGHGRGFTGSARPPFGVSGGVPTTGAPRALSDRLADQPARRTHEGHCEGPGHSPPARPAKRCPPCPLPAAARAQPRAPRHGGTRPLWPLSGLGLEQSQACGRGPLGARRAAGGRSSSRIPVPASVSARTAPL